jgi:cobalt-zinc-cadmium efflux system outer membrane protein
MKGTRIHGTAWLTVLVGASITAPSFGSTPSSGEVGAVSASTAQVQAVLTLRDLEEMALQGNPTLAQAAAQVEAARGRALQSGLYPNPTVGYVADRIGAAGTAGELQGAFIDQLIVTAGKLRLSRAKSCQEVAQAQALALAQQYRVLNGVRIRFYQLLAMDRLLVVRADLLRNADDALTTTEQLVNVGAANRADLLQARIEARQERVALENARVLYQAAWQQVAAFVGNPQLTQPRLQGDLEQANAIPDWDATLAHLLQASPELQAARAEVARDRFALRREQVEPIPNVQVQVSNGYDFETRNDVTSVQVGVRLPLCDRNQGNIRAAGAQLAIAQAEVGRVELSLRQRLAQTHARYRAALATVAEYKSHTLPDAREAYELYLGSFRNRQAAWPQVLVAQRTYFQVSVDYVQALEQLRRAEVSILGLLLVDGLDQPPGPGGEGRVPSREQPGHLPDPISARGRPLEDGAGARGAGAGD